VSASERVSQTTASLRASLRSARTDWTGIARAELFGARPLSELRAVERLRVRVAASLLSPTVKYCTVALVSAYLVFTVVTLARFVPECDPARWRASEARAARVEPARV
jgi:hypothetical protein